VPDAMRTEALCLAAMQGDSEAFMSVPKHLKAKMKEKYLNNILRKKR
jgi:hypothetical protein